MMLNRLCSLWLTLTVVFLVCPPLPSLALSKGRHGPDGLRKGISAAMIYSKVKRTKSSSAILKRRPAGLTIRNRPPPNIVAEYYEPMELECEAGGSPPPEIHWLKDGQRITEESMPQDILESILARSDDQSQNSLNPNDAASERRSESLGLTLTRSRLTLNCASASDVGRYTCVAENPYQRASTDTELTLVKNEVPPKTLGMPPQCASKTLRTIAPRIQMWTHTRLEFIGNDVKLFCRTTGYPEPDISWIGPNDTPLANDLRFQMLPNGDLVINRISWSDMGSYTCVAENSEGSDSVSTFLYPTLAD